MSALARIVVGVAVAASVCTGAGVTAAPGDVTLAASASTMSGTRSVSPGRPSASMEVPYGYVAAEGTPYLVFEVTCSPGLFLRSVGADLPDFNTGTARPAYVDQPCTGQPQTFTEQANFSGDGGGVRAGTTRIYPSAEVFDSQGEEIEVTNADDPGKVVLYSTVVTLPATGTVVYPDAIVSADVICPEGQSLDSMTVSVDQGLRDGFATPSQPTTCTGDNQTVYFAIPPDPPNQPFVYATASITAVTGTPGPGPTLLPPLPHQIDLG